MAAQAAEIIVLRRSAKLRTWLYVTLAAAASVEQPVQIRLYGRQGHFRVLRYGTLNERFR